MPLADIGVETLQFKLTVLSPVHIGTGRTLLPWELVKQNTHSDAWWLVDIDRWLRHPDPLFAGSVDIHSQALKDRLRSGTVRPPESAILGSVRIPPAESQGNAVATALGIVGPGGVRPTQREVDGRLRIPGSTLKGLLATAWLKHLNAARPGSPIITQLPAFQHNPLAAIKVADLILDARDTELVEAHRTYFQADARGQAGFRHQRTQAINKGWLECIPAGTTGLVTFQIHQALRDRRWSRTPFRPDNPKDQQIRGERERVWGVPEAAFKEQLLEALRHLTQDTVMATYQAVERSQEGTNPFLPGFKKGESIWLPLGAGTHSFTKTAEPMPKAWADGIGRALGGGQHDARSNPWIPSRHTLVLARKVLSRVAQQTNVPLGWISLDPIPD